MPKFIIEVETDNPQARSILRDHLESQLLGSIDVHNGTHYDASILCYEDGVDLIREEGDTFVPAGLVYSTDLDGAENNEALN